MVGIFGGIKYTIPNTNFKLLAEYNTDSFQGGGVLNFMWCVKVGCEKNMIKNFCSFFAFWFVCLLTTNEREREAL